MNFSRALWRPSGQNGSSPRGVINETAFQKRKIHRDHVHRVIGQTHVVPIQLIDMHVVLQLIRWVPQLVHRTGDPSHHLIWSSPSSSQFRRAPTTPPLVNYPVTLCKLSRLSWTRTFKVESIRRWTTSIRLFHSSAALIASDCSRIKLLKYSFAASRRLRSAT